MMGSETTQHESLPSYQETSAASAPSHTSSELQPGTVALSGTSIISSTTSTPLYAISSPFSSATNSVTLCSVDSTLADTKSTPTPLLTLTTPTSSPSLTRNVSTSPDFIINIISTPLSTALKFVQGVMNAEKLSLLKGKGWTFDRFVPVSEQTARGDRDVLLHKHERLLKASTAKRDGVKGLEWKIEGAGEKSKGEVVAWSAGGSNGSLVVEKSVDSQWAAILVAAWIASLWKDCEEVNKVPLGKNDLKASLKRAPNNLGKGFGVNEYYAPNDWSDDKK